MWLAYGLKEDRTLVSIEAVASGKTKLKCPYCDGPLTAKKGKRLSHHFAHTGETCRDVERDVRSLPHLPLYDNFNIWLTGGELERFKKLWNRYGGEGLAVPLNTPKLSVFVSEGLLKQNPFRYSDGYEFTKLGKIPVGDLSLNLFSQVQEEKILEKLQILEREVQEAYVKGFPSFNQCLRDLQIYRAELRRVLSQTLYFLEIEIEGNPQKLYKIGVTQRDIEERVKEVRQDLAGHFEAFNIKVLGTWLHRGNVEKYFKHKYSLFRFPVGKLTEYFWFLDADAKKILSDLRRMGAKGLTTTDQAILTGEPSWIEKLIEDEEKAERRSQAIRTGIERAKAWGRLIGRPQGSESPEEFLAKPSSQRAVSALKEGLSLRKAAQRAEVAINTVRKVKDLMDQTD